MRKLQIFSLALLCLLLFGCDHNNQAETRIAIIEPIQHAAMDEIVAGFKQVFAEKYHKPVKIYVENAQADSNLERAIIQKVRDGNYSMIVPIGVDATQMSVSMIQDIPIISLASNFSEQDRKKLKSCNIVAVHDEISSAKMLDFIHQLYPNIKNIVLIHSTSNKIFSEVQATIVAGKKYNIVIKPMMATSLAELYSIGQSIPAKTQAILILKDSLIVSGIRTLSQIAEQQQIPLITEDQGSVKDGAGFALSVHERAIGEAGAELALKVLSGLSVCKLPMHSMEKLTIFVNQGALKKSGQNIIAIKKISEKLGYPVESLSK